MSQLFARRYPQNLAFVLASCLITLSPAIMCAQTPVGGAEQLQSLVDDLAWQLKMTYRHRKEEHVTRYHQLAAALEAWNGSTRSDVDLEVMRGWLRGAIRASMPGSSAPMPQVPQFGRTALASVAAPTPAATETIATPNEETNQSFPSAGEAFTTPEPTVADTQVEQATTTADSSDSWDELWEETPDTKPIDFSDPFPSNPFRDDPVNVASFEESAPTRSPERESRFKPVGRPNAEVGVDLEELTARVRGYNAGLRRVEAASMESGEASAFQLAGWLRELDNLGSQRQFVQIYLDGLNDAERRAVPELDSAAALLAQLGSSIEQRQRQIEYSATSSADAERDILPSLQRKLTEVRMSHGQRN